MKQFSYFALLMVILLNSCTVPGLATATATPVPTETQLPTSTPPPTPTSTPLPTATPDVAATEAAQATQSALVVLDDLDKVLGNTDLPYQDGHLIWQQADPLNIKMKGPDQGILEIDEDVHAGNFILKSEVTWEATGLLICGAVFRSEPNLELGKQYQFAFMRFSGLPGWQIGVYEFGKFQNSPTKTKFSDALNLNNRATNEFLLVVQDDHFTLYLNDVRQGTYYDYSKQRSDGAFGFVGWEQSGQGICKFENSWIWALDGE